MGKVLIQVSASEEARRAPHASTLPGKPLILPRTNLAEEYLPREEAKPAEQGGDSASKEAGSKADVETVSRKKVGACQHLHALCLVIYCRRASFKWNTALCPAWAVDMPWSSAAAGCCNRGVAKPDADSSH